MTETQSASLDQIQAAETEPKTGATGAAPAGTGEEATGPESDREPDSRQGERTEDEVSPIAEHPEAAGTGSMQTEIKSRLLRLLHRSGALRRRASHRTLRRRDPLRLLMPIAPGQETKEREEEDSEEASAQKSSERMAGRRNRGRDRSGEQDMSGQQENAGHTGLLLAWEHGEEREALFRAQWLRIQHQRSRRGESAPVDGIRIPEPTEEREDPEEDRILFLKKL